jgi:hypothetical protein
LPTGSKAERFSIISERPARLGEYFVAHTGDGDVLGMVEESIITSAIMENARDYITAREAEKFASSNARDRSYTSLVRVVGLVDSLKKGNLKCHLFRLNRALLLKKLQKICLKQCSATAFR